MGDPGSETDILHRTDPADERRDHPEEPDDADGRAPDGRAAKSAPAQAATPAADLPRESGS